MTSQNISLSDTKIVSLIKQEKLALSSTAPLSQASEPKWTIRPWSWHKNTNIINYNFKIMETSHCRYKRQHDFTTAWPTSHPFRLFKEVWENWQLSRDAIIIYGNTSKKKKLEVKMNDSSVSGVCPARCLSEGWNSQSHIAQSALFLSTSFLGLTDVKM